MLDFLSRNRKACYDFRTGLSTKQFGEISKQNIREITKFCSSLLLKNKYVANIRCMKMNYEKNFFSPKFDSIGKLYVLLNNPTSLSRMNLFLQMELSRMR